MDPLNYLKIYPIGEGWPEYWVEDARSGEIVYGHPKHAWCIDWVIENHIQYGEEKPEQKRQGRGMNVIFIIFSVGLLALFGIEIFRYRFRPLTSREIIEELNKKYSKME
ncbi:hypothetical protein [Leptospira sanjuanensis]|uniref:hypothetical protein n=1 Tax=Leptospira sanjuanensis TaxID=2879643 RepID=UPI001EE94157|nr:hypothetical protein [Leptospira sanjuanensis]MCG6170264.1 hypothetical protein [Leptospira sanjuanensis]